MDILRKGENKCIITNLYVFAVVVEKIAVPLK